MKRRQIPPVRKPVKNNLTSGTAKQLSEMLQRGFVQHQQGKIKEAAVVYEKVLKTDPNHFDALQLLATAYYQVRNNSKALELFDRAIHINQSNPSVFNNHGNVLKNLKRLDEALTSYDKSISLKPDFVVAIYNRGNVLTELGRLEEALTSYDKAIELKADYAEAYNNRGNALKDLNRMDEALTSYDKVIALKPDYAEAYYNRGNALKDLNRLDEALISYERSITLKPSNEFWFGTALHARMHLCEWKDFDSKMKSISKNIINSKKISVPFNLLALLDDPAIHKIASEIFINEKHPPSPIRKVFVASKNLSKIRVGYFSADFHDHATMHLMAEMFESHDKNRFEIFAFSYGPASSDQWQHRAKKNFSEFIDCNNKSDSEIAKISEDLGVHIAVDLKGFTTDSRTGIFANRAAPIQVNFIGYPGTMGGDYIDYIIADEVLIPEDLRQFYTEKVAYLPHCYQPNCRNRAVSNKSISRSDFGLPENGIVFSSFNNNYKITPDIFASWIRILKQVDGSVLWLLTSNSTAENNLRRYMEEGGVDPARLIFAQKLPVEEHLNRLRLADLMLDTFPCGAHTTCSDALRMGLPVVALMGQSFASRVAASLLTTVGLPELITASLSDYESLAIELAKGPEKLADIRARLQRNFESTPLFNPELFARNLESLYETMYRRHCDGLPVDHIRIPSDAV